MGMNTPKGIHARHGLDGESLVKGIYKAGILILV